MSESERLKLIDELHKPIRKNFKRRKVIFYGIDDLWQGDLVEMQPFANQNNGFKYILTVIDCLSKYAWAIPIKNKSSSNVAEAFKKILKCGRCPKNFQSDQGKIMLEKFIYIYTLCQ